VDSGIPSTFRQPDPWPFSLSLSLVGTRKALPVFAATLRAYDEVPGPPLSTNPPQLIDHNLSILGLGASLYDLQPPYDQFASQPTIGRLSRFLHRLSPRPSAWGPCTPATLAHFTPTTIHNLIRSLRHYHSGYPPPTSAHPIPSSHTLSTLQPANTRRPARARKGPIPPPLHTTASADTTGKGSPLFTASHIAVWPASVSRVLPAPLRSAPLVKFDSRGTRAFDNSLSGPTSLHHNRLSRQRGRTLRHHVWRRHCRRPGWRE
jgi:hypothetical protein